MTPRAIAPWGAIVLALTALTTVAPAQADNANAVVQAAFSGYGGFPCRVLVSGQPASQTSSISGNGKKVTVAAVQSDPLVYAPSANSTDTVAMTGAMHGTVTGYGTYPFTGITATFSGSANSPGDTHERGVCQPSADGYLIIEYRFITAATWVTVDLGTTGTGGTASAQIWSLEVGGGQSLSATSSVMAQSTQRSTFYLPQGMYYLGVAAGVHSDFMKNQTSVSMSGSARLSFAAAGSATGKSVGSATRFATLPAVRDCAHHRANVVVKGVGAANRPKTVQVLAGGRVVRTVNAPARTTTVKVKLRDTSTATLSIKVIPKTGHTRPTLTRAYRACS